MVICVYIIIGSGVTIFRAISKHMGRIQKWVV